MERGARNPGTADAAPDFADAPSGLRVGRNSDSVLRRLMAEAAPCYRHSQSHRHFTALASHSCVSVHFAERPHAFPGAVQLSPISHAGARVPAGGAPPLKTEPAG